MMLSTSLVSLGILSGHCEAQTALVVDRPKAGSGIWISRDEIEALPMEGPAWEALASFAHAETHSPDLSNQDDPTNVRVLAKALYAVRTSDPTMSDEVRRALVRVQGTEADASALAVSRELIAYVIAADVVGLEGEDRRLFENWLRRIQVRSFQGRSIRATHEERPNNWGTHAGATRLAIAAYLDDRQEIARAANVFAGWTGEPTGWQGFEFGAPWWQPERGGAFAVNPPRATRQGHPIGGVLPDDQRRAGPFQWPPPHENYVYEALQGAVAQAVILDRLGYDAWGWGDRALMRAFEWLHEQAHFPAEGDDTWIPHLINHAYGSQFPAPSPSNPGKGMGFSDWTHAPPIAVERSGP